MGLEPATDPQPILILASASPRRGAILEQMGVVYERQPAQLDESAHPSENGVELCRRLARHKAAAVHEQNPGRVVLGADTLVEHNGKIMGKPRDANDGQSMLARLAGDRHYVRTAMALIDIDGHCHERMVTSVVAMRAIPADEISAYWASGEPVDKAGGYAIQGRGGVFVEHLSGTGSAVAGLDCCQTWQLLQAAGLGAHTA